MAVSASERPTASAVPSETLGLRHVVFGAFGIRDVSGGLNFGFYVKIQFPGAPLSLETSQTALGLRCW